MMAGDYLIAKSPLILIDLAADAFPVLLLGLFKLDALLLFDRTVVFLQLGHVCYRYPTAIFNFSVYEPFFDDS